jgi:hypothetical protein
MHVQFTMLQQGRGDPLDLVPVLVDDLARTTFGPGPGVQVNEALRSLTATLRET